MHLYCVFYTNNDGSLGVHYDFYSSFDSAYDEFKSVNSGCSIFRIERSNDREFMCYEA